MIVSAIIVFHAEMVLNGFTVAVTARDLANARVDVGFNLELIGPVGAAAYDSNDATPGTSSDSWSGVVDAV